MSYIEKVIGPVNLEKTTCSKKHLALKKFLKRTFDILRTDLVVDLTFYFDFLA